MVGIPEPLRASGTAAPATQAFNVSWVDGCIVGIDPVAGSPRSTLISCPVDLHAHIDKNYTVGEVGGAEGNLAKAIELMAAHSPGWTERQLHERMTRALEDAWRCGTRALRTHLDWPETGSPLSLSALTSVRDQWRGRIDLQFVSLTSLDRFDRSGGAEGRARVLATTGGILGVFIYRNVDCESKLRRAFELAVAHRLSLDFHVDEGLDADATALRLIAQLTIEYDLCGLVTCGHACSLAMQPIDEAMGTLNLCALAGIHLVALPTTNLYLQGSWQHTPVERGMTRLREAANAGVNVSVATDNVADSFYPYGSYDLLETFGLGVQMAHLPSALSWMDLITCNPARAMGLAWDGVLDVGAPADLVLLDAASDHEVITPSGRRRSVYRGGFLIAGG